MAAEVDRATTRRTGAKVTIDLTRLDVDDAPERDMLARYLGMIQVQRQDFNGRVLTIRREDLRAIACMLDTRPDADAPAARYWPRASSTPARPDRPRDT